MTQGHTPGPWRIMPYGDGDSLVIHDARCDWRVCFMATPGSNGEMEGIRANARLIAAAPALVEALINLVNAVGDHPTMSVDRADQIARAALSSAGAK